MPVIINEIEVLEQPAPASPDRGSPSPPTAPAVQEDGILRVLRDAEGRQRRLVAD
ncbi:MAG: hypothetical protein ABSF03_22275 [Streptosporangiaceae bacterium]